MPAKFFGPWSKRISSLHLQFVRQIGGTLLQLLDSSPFIAGQNVSLTFLPNLNQISLVMLVYFIVVSYVSSLVFGINFVC